MRTETETYQRQKNKLQTLRSRRQQHVLSKLVHDVGGLVIRSEMFRQARNQEPSAFQLFQGPQKPRCDHGWRRSEASHLRQRRKKKVVDNLL